MPYENSGTQTPTSASTASSRRPTGSDVSQTNIGGGSTPASSLDSFINEFLQESMLERGQVDGTWVNGILVNLPRPVLCPPSQQGTAKSSCGNCKTAPEYTLARGDIRIPTDAAQTCDSLDSCARCGSMGLTCGVESTASTAEQEAMIRKKWEEVNRYNLLGCSRPVRNNGSGLSLQ